MIELLANADPFSVPMLAMLAFAAGMYPMGLMLGAPCSACCGCSKCATGSKLPDTLTVSFDGFPEQTKSADLVSLSFDACFGSGAAGRVTAPGGDPGVDDGPISAVELTNNGSGYAVLGRVEPTVTASASAGTGAKFSVTLAKQQDLCNRDYWEVSSVSVTDGGSGYSDGGAITFAVSPGDTASVAASASLSTSRSAPSLTASSSGSATFSLTYTQATSSPDTWEVSGITLTDAGTGSINDEYLTFSLGTGDVKISSAVAKISTVRGEPTLGIGVETTSGSGATFSVSLTKTTDYSSRDAWTISDITITDGGSGYVENEWLFVEPNEATEASPFEGFVSGIDENGAITDVTINDGGLFFGDTGVVDAVDLMAGGAYYRDAGVISSVSVSGGGRYWREDSKATPYVSDVTVKISQSPPSNGSGAVLAATVNSTVGNEDFGKITAITIANPGDNYLAWKWLPVCVSFYNGLSVVLKRSVRLLQFNSPDHKCLFTHQLCDNGSLQEPNPSDGTGVMIVAEYRGPDTPPRVIVPRIFTAPSDAPTPAQFEFVGGSNVTDCGSWGEIVATHAGTGATATITDGGEYDPTFKNPGFACSPCCRGDSIIPDEIEVEVVDTRPLPAVDASGTYVLPASLSGAGQILWVLDAPTAVVAIRLKRCDLLNCEGSECVAKCVVQSTLTVYGEADQNWYSYENGEQCLDCEAVPVCSPVGRVFSMRLLNGTRDGEITVSV